MKFSDEDLEGQNYSEEEKEDIKKFFNKEIEKYEFNTSKGTVLCFMRSKSVIKLIYSICILIFISFFLFICWFAYDAVINF